MKRLDGRPWNAGRSDSSKHKAQRARLLRRLGTPLPEIANRLDVSKRQVIRYLKGVAAHG